jgi:phosphoheptose isomerase
VRTATAGSDVTERARSILDRTVAVHAGLRDGDLLPLAAACRAIVTALRSGGRVLVFGNGGSAAEAQHFAAELSGRFERERCGLAAIALTTDTSALTAIANDYGFERVFARQVEALGRPGDAAVAISTSGASPNVVAGQRAARAGGLVTIALTGRDGGALGREAHIHVNVPASETARVQEAQLTLLHVLCEVVDDELTAAPPGAPVAGEPGAPGSANG